MRTKHIYSDTERSNWVFTVEQGVLAIYESYTGVITQVPQHNLTKVNLGTGFYWDVLSTHLATVMSMNIGLKCTKNIYVAHVKC